MCIRDRPVNVHEHERGVAIRATLDVPADAPFFADHFPRRPVFPATLLLDAQMKLAATLVGETQGTQREAPRPLRATHVKMRSFIAPGQALDLTLDVKPPVDGVAKASMHASTDGRVVGGARLEMQVHHD